MEKNGAITTNTPSCGNSCSGCCNGNCSCKVKRASVQSSAKQPLLFPETKEAADTMEQDLIKRAVEAVQERSRTTR